MVQANSLTFLQRHEFLIRRLHSLSGLIPVGAYMCIHLMTNASINNGAATFQEAVYTIHSFGRLLPLIEWTFIFIPLLFHAVVGVVIVAGGLPNTTNYPYKNNIRYSLQRATGMIAFVFILWHVFHMHGWFHNETWVRNVAEPLGGKQFAPYNAASSVGAAMAGFVVPALYAIGVLASVYHLANGIWTMGITWGVWVSPQAQARANWVCLIFGVLLSVVGLGALYGTVTVDQEQAREIEDKMFDARVAAGRLDAESAAEKRAEADEEAEGTESGESATESPTAGQPTAGVQAAGEQAAAEAETASTAGTGSGNR